MSKLDLPVISHYNSNVYLRTKSAKHSHVQTVFSKSSGIRKPQRKGQDVLS